MTDQYLFVDTETTGLFDFKKPADAPGQPRLAHLAMIRTDPDGTIERADDYYAWPDRWVMPPEAGKINGLTTEFLRERGIPIGEILDAYEDAVIRENRVVVAFNAQYDLKIMRGEFRRAQRADHFEVTRNICVMRPMTDICRLPGRFPGQFKFPKLIEALSHLGETHEKAHNALADVEGARTVFLYLKSRGLLPTAAVHFAKERI